MSDARPEPFVPPDVDVRDLDGFMLNVERLLASELVATATPEECWAALMLWCRAWKQVPGGSLPNDERVLAGFAGVGRRWGKVRGNAMHGFVLCSDDRFYHRFLCAEVLRAYDRKLAFQRRRETDRKRLSEWRGKLKSNERKMKDETRFVAEGTGTGTGTGTQKEGSVGFANAQPTAPTNGAGKDFEADPTKRMWAKGLVILGGNRSLLGKLAKEHGQVAVLEGIEQTEANKPPDPAAYLLGVLRKRGPSTVSERPFTIGVG